MSKTLVIDDAVQSLTNKTINGMEIELNSVSDGQTLVYDSASGKFKNGSGGGSSDSGELGEIKQFALSISGAVTKATLQGKGWAICDGTTATAQGISGATIENTPDLRSKFLRHSANETTGGTGGSETHNHQWHQKIGTSNQYGLVPSNAGATDEYGTYNSDGTNLSFKDALSGNYLGDPAYTNKVDTKPPYYDICYFIKVK